VEFPPIVIRRYRETYERKAKALLTNDLVGLGLFPNKTSIIEAYSEIDDALIRFLKLTLQTTFRPYEFLSDTGQIDMIDDALNHIYDVARINAKLDEMGKYYLLESIAASLYKPYVHRNLDYYRTEAGELVKAISSLEPTILGQLASPARGRKAIVSVHSAVDELTDIWRDRLKQDLTWGTNRGEIGHVYHIILTNTHLTAFSPIYSGGRYLDHVGWRSRYKAVRLSSLRTRLLAQIQSSLRKARTPRQR
jgi:hypothetical protein